MHSVIRWRVCQIIDGHASSFVLFRYMVDITYRYN